MELRTTKQTTVLSVTGATTLTRAQSGAFIHNLSATGDVVVSLPTGSQQGDEFQAQILVNHYISVVPTDATDVVVLNGTALTAGLGAKSTTIGAHAKFLNIGGGKWTLSQNGTTNWATTT